MAIASFGHEFSKERKDVITVNSSRSLDFYTDFEFYGVSREVVAEIEASRRQGQLNDIAVAFAARGQEIFNEEMLRLAQLARAKTGSRNICMTGGSSLSCVANRVVRAHAGFDDIFVQPAASDEGIALGCALYGYHMLAGGRSRRPMHHAYLAHPQNPARLPALLDGLGLPWQQAGEDRVAGLLADGKIIGRCVGASECGPRALGNRSILADPRPTTIVERLNRDIKHRESFRPFAPSVVFERQGDYFVDAELSPFMVVATAVRPEWAARIPGVVHVDGSSRVQSVVEAANPGYHRLLSEFGHRTGIYCLVNTSFNDNDEPIVETYEDAIASFQATNLDHLFVDGLLVDRPARDFTAVAATLRGQIKADVAKRQTDLAQEMLDPAILAEPAFT